MRQLCSFEVIQAEKLFEQSVYQNLHLGWLDLIDISRNYGTVWLAKYDERFYMTVLQPNCPDTVWLHSLYCSGSPADYPLKDQLRKMLPPEIRFIYTISSNDWYSELLRKNGFMVCDEIVQFETGDIQIPEIRDPLPQQEFFAGDIPEVYEICESAFPSLWRMGIVEFRKAWDTANYRKVLILNDRIAGYILADISGGQCDIFRLATDPNYQHRGAAYSMLRHLVSFCREQGIAGFSVNTDRMNSIAYRFYEKLNFQKTDSIYPVFFCRLNEQS